ncbi:hypothetical protein ACU615_21490 [Klebsiella aerogenes]
MNTLLTFQDPTPIVTTESPCYCCSEYPPPDDFVISINLDGQPLSYYGDTIWDFRYLGAKMFSFKNWSISYENLRLVKQALYLVLYHPLLFPGKITSCHIHYIILVKIGMVCSKSNILVSQLSFFPDIQRLVVEELQCSSYRDRIVVLHKLLQFSDELGFIIADDKTISYFLSQCREHNRIQFPYIPPRIWSYQLNRLDEFLSEFIRLKDSFELIYTELIDIYRDYGPRDSKLKKYGPLKNRGLRIKDCEFDNYLNYFNLFKFFDKWLPGRIDTKGCYRIQSLGRIFSLAQEVAIFYILNFSLQRRSEVGTLRSDCFIIENDPRLGDICLIRGETTKTITDSDARWVVPRCVKKAVDVSSFVSRLRMINHPAGISEDIINNPYLLTPAWDPWFNVVKSNTACRPTPDFSVLVRREVKLFNKETLIVSEEDWKIALSLTPNLHQHPEFGLGLPWHFSAHQLRRTTNVNMFSSSMVSDKSLQWSMKHLSRDMTLYYGRNYTNLKLNSSAESCVLTEYYNNIYRNLTNIVSKESKYIKNGKDFHFTDELINIVNEGDEKKLMNLINNGSVSCRKTLVGYCMKNTSCEYGGIESVSKCCGGQDGSLCSHAIIFKDNAGVINKLIDVYERELANIDLKSKRAFFVNNELCSLRRFIHETEK